MAGPFLSEAGDALGPGGELLLLAGNHDHGLVAGWIDARLQSEPSGFLGLRAGGARHAGRLATRLAELARPARPRFAYPGVWLRDDVYAIHGHYVDLHSTVPTFERLAAGAMARWSCGCRGTARARRLRGGARADLRVPAPAHAALRPRGVSAGAGASARAWVAMAGEGRARTLWAAALGSGFTLPSARSTRSASARSTATSPARRCAAAACTGSARCCAGSASPRRT